MASSARTLPSAPCPPRRCDETAAARLSRKPLTSNERGFAGERRRRRRRRVVVVGGGEERNRTRLPFPRILPDSLLSDSLLPGSRTSPPAFVGPAKWGGEGPDREAPERATDTHGAPETEGERGGPAQRAASSGRRSGGRRGRGPAGTWSSRALGAPDESRRLTYPSIRPSIHLFIQNAANNTLS